MSAFLFSVDVEDGPDGEEGRARVPALIGRYLEFLRRHSAHGTFFIVGETARRHRSLVREIAAEGHEIGCHSDRHIALDRLDPASFREDTIRNLDALDHAGAPAVAGYRAPYFSLTRKTRWAHDVLAELGFRYSSSVLPAPSPLHGWPGFGRAPKQVAGELWEIPISTLGAPFPPLPSAGGVYFRVLPKWLIKRALVDAVRRAELLAGYFHPYDIDTAAAQSGFRRTPFQLLMRHNRDRMFERIELAARLGCRFQPFARHVDDLARQVKNDVAR